MFVQVVEHGSQAILQSPEKASPTYFPVRQIQGRGQTLAVAKPVKAGDTSVEVSHLVFDGEIDHDNVTSRPFLTEMRAHRAVDATLSPQAPAVDLVYAKPYLAHGLPPRALDAEPVPGTPNAGELILALKSPPAAVDFTKGSDRSGGFVAPNLSVEGISRALGAIGESGNAPTAFDAGKFDPASFLSGAMPKLFGLFSLLELLDAAGSRRGAGLRVRRPGTLSPSCSPRRSVCEAAIDDAQARLRAGGRRGGPRRRAGRRPARQGRARRARRPTSSRTSTRLIAARARAARQRRTRVSAAAVALAGRAAAAARRARCARLPAAVRSALAKPVQALTTLTDLAKDAAGLAQMLRGRGRRTGHGADAVAAADQAVGAAGRPQHLQAQG